MSILEIKPKTDWNLEEGFLIYNILTHITQGLNNNPKDMKELLDYSSIYAKHISEKFIHHKIPHQVLMMKHPKIGDCCAVLDCGGSFWSIIGKDIESILNYMGVDLEEQKLFTLYPKKIKKKYIDNVSEFVKESYPEILIPEFPIYSPITWENISFLEFKFTPTPKLYRKNSFIINNAVVLHEHFTLENEKINIMAQQAIAFSSKKPVDEFYVNICGEKDLEVIDVDKIQKSLEKSHDNIKKLYNEYRISYKNSERPQQWTSYLIKKISQISELVLKLKGNQTSSFLIEEFSSLDVYIQKHHRLQLEVDTIEKEKILLELVTLGLLGNKQIKKNSNENLSYYVPLDNFVNPYFIHSKKHPHIYAYSNPTWDSTLKKMKKINVSNDDDAKNWYTLNKHPFSEYFGKHMVQINFNSKISPNSLKNKPKNRF